MNETPLELSFFWLLSSVQGSPRDRVRQGALEPNGVFNLTTSVGHTFEFCYGADDCVRFCHTVSAAGSVAVNFLVSADEARAAIAAGAERARGLPPSFQCAATQLTLEMLLGERAPPRTTVFGGYGWDPLPSLLAALESRCTPQPPQRPSDAAPFQFVDSDLAPCAEALRPVEMLGGTASDFAFRRLCTDVFGATSEARAATKTDGRFSVDENAIVLFIKNDTADAFSVEWMDYSGSPAAEHGVCLPHSTWSVSTWPLHVFRLVPLNLASTAATAKTAVVHQPVARLEGQQKAEITLLVSLLPDFPPSQIVLPSLFGPSGLPHANDVIQHGVGDCWFHQVCMSATRSTRAALVEVFGAAATDPTAFEKCCRFGVFSFKFRHPRNLDRFDYYVVDDFVLAKRVAPRSALHLARCVVDERGRAVVWVALLEKLIAKMRGGFGFLHARTDADRPGRFSLLDLHVAIGGGRPMTFTWKSTTCLANTEIDESVWERNQLWPLLLSLNAHPRSFASLSSAPCVAGASATGFVSFHGHGLLRTYETHDDHGNVVQLLKVRETCAHIRWAGDWSRHSPLWRDHPRLHAEVWETVDDEGTTVLSLADFKQHFCVVWVNLM